MFPMTVNGHLPFTPNYSKDNVDASQSSSNGFVKSPKHSEHPNKDLNGNFKSFRVKLKTFFKSNKFNKTIKSNMLDIENRPDVNLDINDLQQINRCFSSVPQFSPLSIIYEEEEPKHHNTSNAKRAKLRSKTKCHSNVKLISPNQWKTEPVKSHGDSISSELSSSSSVSSTESF